MIFFDLLGYGTKNFGQLKLSDFIILIMKKGLKGFEKSIKHYRRLDQIDR